MKSSTCFWSANYSNSWQLMLCRTTNWLASLFSTRVRKKSFSRQRIYQEIYNTITLRLCILVFFPWQVPIIGDLLWHTVMRYKLWVCLPGSLIHGGPHGGERPGCHREDRTHACERITLPVKKSCWVYPLFSRRKVTSVHCWAQLQWSFYWDTLGMPISPCSCTTDLQRSPRDWIKFVYF